MPRAKQPLNPVASIIRPVFFTLSEQLAERIAEEILNERLAPGRRMKEAELSATFGVSRASIREALRLLEGRGLVQIEPRRGARVTQLSADEVDDLYEIRANLLSVAVRRVAARRDAKFLASAQALLARINESASQLTHGKYFEAVYALSGLIAEGAGSERLAALIRSFSQQVARYTRLSLRSPERRKKSAQSWRRLVSAIEARDSIEAEEAMRQLVTGSQEAIREILRTNSGKQASQRRGGTKR